MRDVDWEEPYETYYACEGCEFVYDSHCLTDSGPFDLDSGLPSKCPRCGTDMPNWERVKDILQREAEAREYNTHTERQEFEMIRYPDRSSDDQQRSDSTER